MNYPLTFLFALLLLSASGKAQLANYQWNGSAKPANDCNCYTLTEAQLNQSGSVWNRNKISLNQPFDFWFNVFLGCNDGSGADGIVFTLQPISTSVGSSGGGMGYQGISPSIGVALDTWQNNNDNDPSEDHISIQKNGNISHTGQDLAPPVPVSSSSPNVEDCQWHTLRISWDPATKWFRAYFDGVLRVQTQVDLVADVFRNDPMVFWGFTGATGGSFNLQQFCTALDPKFETNLADNTTCFVDGGVSVQFRDRSESFAPIDTYSWDFANGQKSTLPNPVVTFTKPGIYNVKMGITGKDGCKNDTTVTVTIGATPEPSFRVEDLCLEEKPVLNENSKVAVGTISKWEWTLNGTTVLNGQQPDLSSAKVGTNRLKLRVSSEFGCTAEAPEQTFMVKEIPVVEATLTGACLNEPISFTGTQLDAATNITQWLWKFGDSASYAQQGGSHVFNRSGSVPVTLMAVGENGCRSKPVNKTLVIHESFADAGPDAVVLRNVPYAIHAEGRGSFLWSPADGLTNPLIANPMATLEDDRTYALTVISPEGCVAKDTLTLTVFKGSGIFVPTAFSPNGDGKNDLLLPHYKGIRKLYHFTIFNRWGERVFSTSDPRTGWDGRMRGAAAGTQSFVWMAKAEDFVGQVYELKGTFTLIR